jgi:tetratricopeptide (TPR) repeat protein
MGRSLGPLAAVRPIERYDSSSHNPLTTPGLDLRVERQGGHVLHQALRPDGPPATRIESEAEVQYAIGSGQRGRSYLIERDGYLVQSPLTWYVEKGVWDLSPHLGSTPDPFYRPVRVECLFCHSNGVEPFAPESNRYRQQLFRGYAIGCERCHGPGERHVRRHEAGEEEPGPDETIVNPARLTPTLREAVCQQCHLGGVIRVLRRGRQFFDYRPGLPTSEFWTVFVGLPEFSDTKATGQVEQMAASRCYQASAGQLGCTSCHDPHELPRAEARLAYYRERCLQCHQKKACGLTPASRQEQKDNCMACHMPRRTSADVAHASVTDHRIPRRPEANPSTGRNRALRPDEVPLVNFHRREAAGSPETDRALGLALADLAGGKQAPALRGQLVRLALPLLEAAAQRAPDDLPVVRARGFVFWLGGRRQKAQAAFEAALALAPDDETTLTYAAGLAVQAGQNQALDLCQRALVVNPWNERSQYEVARLRGELGDWPGALNGCRVALGLSPAYVNARRLLVSALLQTGQKEQARAELARLLELNPPDAAALRQWSERNLR